MGKNPPDRVKALLGKLHSITISKNRGSKISKKAELLFNKFVKQVDKIFKNLPKPLEWQSFYVNDFPLLMDICKEVQEISIQHNLNKSQTRALAQKLGVIQQTVNAWISDIRGRRRAGREIIIIRLHRLACPPSFLSAFSVAEWRSAGPARRYSCPPFLWRTGGPARRLFGGAGLRKRSQKQWSWARIVYQRLSEIPILVISILCSLRPMTWNTYLGIITWILLWPGRLA